MLNLYYFCIYLNKYRFTYSHMELTVLNKFLYRTFHVNIKVTKISINILEMNK